MERGLIFLGVVIAVVFSLNIYVFDNDEVTRIYESNKVSQPYILYTVVDDKVFEGFSGSIVIREVKNGKIYRVEKKESQLAYSIEGDRILKANTGSVQYIFKNNIIYKGSKLDTASILYRLKSNGWITDKTDKKVIYTCEGKCELTNLASTILLR